MLAFAIRVGGCLIAEHYGHERRSAQRFDSEAHTEFGDGQNGGTEEQLGDSHEDARDRQFADSPGVGQRRRPHVVGRQGHPEEIASEHYDDHQHGSQDCVSGHDQTHSQKEHLHEFLVNGV